MNYLVTHPRGFYLVLMRVGDAHILDLNSGSYGADITIEKLKDFHRRRLQVLAGAGPDLIAFEAIPNKMEAQVHSESEPQCEKNCCL